MSTAAFDHVAEEYDRQFTHTLIGQAQRNQVWSHVDEWCPVEHKLNVLELNCGTGEDAIRFASKGHAVVATDQSEKMLEVVKLKAAKAKVELTTQVFDLTELAQMPKGRFDVVFSNFGGLNCLSAEQLRALSSSLSSQIQAQGLLMAVVMPKHCKSERNYFLKRGQIRKAFRRNTNQALEVHVDGKMIKTWYYNVEDVHACFEEHFTLKAAFPIGHAVPPSYLESKMEQSPKRFERLVQQDRKNRTKQALSNYSDHTLVILQRKE